MPNTAQPIALKGVGVYHGPSPYAAMPVVVADLSMAETPRADAPALIEVVRDHFSDWDLQDPFASGLSDGEALASFALHWAHTALTQVPGLIEPAGMHRIDESRFRLWIGFHRPNISQHALILGAQVLSAAMSGKLGDADLATRLERLQSACDQYHPKLQDQIILTGVRSADVPILPAWGLDRTWQFGWGARGELNSNGSTNRNGTVTIGLSSDKLSSKAMIEGLGLPTPPCELVHSERELTAAVRKVGFPCVAKPVNGFGGKGVTANLTTPEQVREAFQIARDFANGPVLIEQFAPGADHRIWILNNRVVCVSRRDLPEVIGNGSDTIDQLIDTMNIGRGQGGRLGFDTLGAVAKDKGLLIELARQGMTLQSIPDAGRQVTLRSNANLSTGGAITDVTDTMHPDIIAACEMLSATLDFDMAGLDYITTDISKSWREVPGAFIELNNAPVCQVMTTRGWSNADAGKLVLTERIGRIPLDLVIVAPGTANESFDHFSALLPDEHTGLAAHHRANIGTMGLNVPASALWEGVAMVLAHGIVERAIIVADSARIVQHGLPVDRADRIWNCDASLSGDWTAALARASHAPVWQGGWTQLIDEFSFETSSTAATV